MKLPKLPLNPKIILIKNATALKILTVLVNEIVNIIIAHMRKYAELLKVTGFLLELLL